MTSEEIIQRLLDERKISVKEALIILTDLAKIGIRRIFDPTPIKTTPYTGDVVVMYGVTTSPYTYTAADHAESNVCSATISATC